MSSCQRCATFQATDYALFSYCSIRFVTHFDLIFFCIKYNVPKKTKSNGEESDSGTSHCQGSRNSHRFVMPPDTVSMEKRELSSDDHPLIISLQRPLKKHHQSPNQRALPCISTPQSPKHSEAFPQTLPARFAGTVTTPRARDYRHELTDAAARDQPGRKHERKQ